MAYPNGVNPSDDAKEILEMLTRTWQKVLIQPLESHHVVVAICTEHRQMERVFKELLGLLRYARPDNDLAVLMTVGSIQQYRIEMSWSVGLRLKTPEIEHLRGLQVFDYCEIVYTAHPGLAEVRTFLEAQIAITRTGDGPPTSSG